MNFKEAQEYIEYIGKFGSVLGLEPIRELLDRLGNPQDRLDFVHIAGTNGKGSTLAFISTILKCAGCKVGRYISPVVFDYLEKIQVNGECISEEEFSLLAARVKDAADSMEKDGLQHPTAFEVETALAFLYFESQGCDVVVLETGLGGKLDATNIIRNTKCAVITSISMDHMGVLGSTLGEIAANKAGIIKSGAVVVSAMQEHEAEEAIRLEAAKYGCEVRIADMGQACDIEYGFEKQRFSYKGYRNLEISLAGSCQISNAILAVEAADALKAAGYPVSEDALRRGLKEASWTGRFTPIHREPFFIIDGAHNIDAAIKLKESLKLYFSGRRLIFIIGIFADKEHEKIIREMAPLASKIITVTPPGPRGMPAEALADEIRRFNKNVTWATGLEEAALESMKAAGPEDVIVAFGSLSYLGEMKRIIERLFH
ncbi:bifunctional folylpolyglutamate synthase/dihydrofolate synthase [Anaerobium acetethylicum]|uniref:tetrahydrofolate synthase n=1 Tax=Anaerobium acetethylicum TaxID=1619234 RepID=A0A1D3TS48_9FIRM|nr:folylpolyglutamate synthase/dihydrofolate synthase family protein [Anaerobium acetethylicum]SCP96605.1 dihydrofolate synthase / folylpolyglutamate synthase [Anaerobium acetethylicum]